MSGAKTEETNKIPVEGIPKDSFFSQPVYLEDNFILAAPEMPFSDELANVLLDWEFTEVQSSGTVLKDYAADKAGQAEGLEPAEATVVSDNEKIRRAELFYDAFQKYVEVLFTKVSIKNELDFKSVAEKIKNACEIVRDDRRYLLRVLKNTMENPNTNYLASHAIKTTIIAIIIGTYLKLPNHRLIELGISALLHEIGMIKLPPQMYLSKRALQPQERKAILTHPLLGFNVLKTFDFPLNITLGALEHHER